jgi:hypothetical protein
MPRNTVSGGVTTLTQVRSSELSGCGANVCAECEPRPGCSSTRVRRCPPAESCITRAAIVRTGVVRTTLRQTALEFDARLSDVAQPPPRILDEAALDQRPNSARCVARQRIHVGRRVQHRAEHVRQRLADERPLRRQALVEHTPERPHVDAPVDRLAARLLRRHIRRRAEQSPRLRRQHAVRRRVPVAFIARRLREPEVEHLHPSVRRHAHVRRLQIAVDHTRFVRRFEPLRNLSRDIQCLAHRQRPAPKSLLQRLPRHQLQHEEVQTSVLIDAEDLRDVRMIQCRERARLPLEPAQPLLLLRELRRQHLDRHVAPEPRVARPPHLPHRPRAEPIQDREVEELGAGSEGHEARRLTSAHVVRRDATLRGLPRAQRPLQPRRSCR